MRSGSGLRRVAAGELGRAPRVVQDLQRRVAVRDGGQPGTGQQEVAEALGRHQERARAVLGQPGAGQRRRGAHERRERPPDRDRRAEFDDLAAQAGKCRLRLEMMRVDHPVMAASPDDFGHNPFGSTAEIDPRVIERKPHRVP